MCLCLPAHSTHLLQPLDVGVFGPLKQNYKTLLAAKTRFTTYNIDKADFISLIQKARQQGITSRNIQSALRATYIILPLSLTKYQPVIRKVILYLALIHPYVHVFFPAKYHQHLGISNRSQRWRSLYLCFATRLLILLNLPSYINPSKQLGLQ